MTDETTTLIQPAATPTKKKKGEAEEAVKVTKRYAIKVGGKSPVRMVRSAGTIFTDTPQIFSEDDERFAEWQANDWLEVSEVTE